MHGYPSTSHARKTPNTETGVTAGIEVDWEDEVRRKYSVDPLYGLFLPGGEAWEIGLRTH